MAPTTYRCKELGDVIARSFHQRSIVSWEDLKEGLRLRAPDADKEIDVLMKRPDKPPVARGGFNKLMAMGKVGGLFWEDFGLVQKGSKGQEPSKGRGI